MPPEVADSCINQDSSFQLRLCFGEIVFLESTLAVFVSFLESLGPLHPCSAQ